MFETKYRVVTDNYAGYEVQYKPWWCPFYLVVKGKDGTNTNTFCNMFEAIDYAESLKRRPHKSRVVYNV